MTKSLIEHDPVERHDGSLVQTKFPRSVLEKPSVGD
jgi:hypothetical protein